MRWLPLILRAVRRVPYQLALVVAAVLMAGLIWAHGNLSARRAAELEALKLERTTQGEILKQSEELRDEFRKIEESAAVAGDDAVVDELQRGHFSLAPGFADAPD